MSGGQIAAEQEELQARLAELDAGVTPIALHPAENYRRICADPHAHLERVRAADPADDLIERARELIARIDLHPGSSKEPVGLTLHGLLSSLLVGHDTDGGPRVRGAMVAGA